MSQRKRDRESNGERIEPDARRKKRLGKTNPKSRGVKDSKARDRGKELFGLRDEVGGQNARRMQISRANETEAEGAQRRENIAIDRRKLWDWCSGVMQSNG